MKTKHNVSISSLAKSNNVSTATLRYYEKLGLIQSEHRSPHGTRYFPARASATLRAILRFQRMGFTLREMLSLLKLPMSHTAHRARFSSLIKQKLAEVKVELAEAKKKKTVLTRALHLSAARGSSCTCDLGSLLGRNNE